MSSTGKPIVIKGARVHNLKNINVEIPQNTITVITGLSGSGKSSLAFDTIYAEGQRRYVESLSTYARQFLGQMDKADVDSIEGLSPAIAIEQKTTQRNPRSTVGTVTEIYDHLRLLWARIGTPHCPKCKKVVHAMPPEKIVDAVLLGSKNEKIKVLAPLASAKKGTFKKEIAALKKDGFLKAKIDGEFVGLDDIEELPKTVRHDIDVVVDRIAVKNANRSRIHEAIELGLKTANGLIVIENDKGDRQLFSEHSACPDCGIGIEPLDPKHFSFNSPHGACHDCLGLGVHFDVDPGKVIGDKKLSILKGCIVPWGENPQKKWFGRRLWKLKGDVGIDLDVPWKELTEQTKKLILFGRAASKTATENSHWERRRRPFEGVVANLQRRYKETNSSVVREWIEQYMTLRECPVCDGERIKETSRVVTVSSKNGDDEYRLPELLKLTIEDIGHWLNKINLDATKRKIGERLIEEIQSRLGFLEEVGLEYLTLERNAATLSGGEAQRIRLATQLGSRLRGVLYVLDEPSIGLHPADTSKLLNTLRELRDLGNTVIVVEHDRDTIMAADYVIDMGPGAGRHGGDIVAMGTPKQIATQHQNSLTGAYLSGTSTFDHSREERPPRPKESIKLKGVTTNNLKGVDIEIKLGNLICVTGVSGSGKSSLIMDTLYPAIKRELGMIADPPGPYKKLLGVEYIEKIIGINQSAIGRTSRSNPATYTGVFTSIRDLFSGTRDARERGYKPGRFSFNVKGGRCESCQGAGVKVVEMHFLPDVYIECEACNGKRYNRETLEVKYKGKTISDVLEMTIEEASEFFVRIPPIRKWLDMLNDVGLGYLQLGQSAPTLSGGEAQRLKLASELGKNSRGKTLYILDEPTTGLHIEDVRILMKVLDRLVDRGDTIIIVEHHPEVMAHADFVIDLGPGSGQNGGELVIYAPPRVVAKEKRSLTGHALAEIFN